MIRDLTRFSQGVYDCLVVGGGINGAAVAHLAALNGLKTALLEKQDFASGTSSKSTKLMHGGLRYLENFEFDLVQESLKERTIQLKSIPYLVKPLSFIVPVYKNDQRPLWMMKLGVTLYDVLSGKYRIGQHGTLSADEVIKKIPYIKKENLIGGVVYFDAQMDDARVCLENVLQADKLGADIANYVEVTDLIKELGRTVGVRATDTFTNMRFDIRAKKVVFALGPWSNFLLFKEHKEHQRKLRLTKGVHIVYRGKFSDEAMLIQTQKDKRIFFIIPWKGNTLIGTTDTDYQESLDQVVADDNDIEYLFQEASRVFPGHELKRENIITTFAGLRPLVNQAKSPSKVSRKHVIEETYSGNIFVLGGKYTTYRKVAEDCIKTFIKKRPVDMENNFKLYGSGNLDENIPKVAQEFNVIEPVIENLINTYGARFRDVLVLAKNSPSLKEPLCSCSRVIKAQVVYAIKVEMAVRFEDIYERRLSLHYNDCSTKNCQKVIHDLMLKNR